MMLILQLRKQRTEGDILKVRQLIDGRVKNQTQAAWHQSLTKVSLSRLECS